jgi:hydroxymethylpyrimidine pyrophosphatase-like HAD family hydrolase
LNIPAHINIITWNFDFQLEQAFLGYKPYITERGGFIHKEGKTVHEFLDDLNIYPRVNPKETTDRGAIVHLNGISGFYYRKGEPDNMKTTWGEDIYYKDLEDYNSLISFAWDEDEFSRQCRQKALEILKETHILVIIGYSFPYFNRAFDDLIFPNKQTKAEIQKITQIERVYLQDTPEKADIKVDYLKHRFGDFFEHCKIFKAIKETDQFFLP